MLSEEQFFREFDKIKEKFSLIHECIIPIYSIEYAEDWNDEKQCYEVEHKIRGINYYIIRELL